jgi:thioredoxin-related protein
MHAGPRQLRVKSTKDFNHVLDNNNMVVALFYKSDRETRKNRQLSRNIELLENMMLRVAGRDRYKDAHIAFVRINTVGHDLEELAHDYEVNTVPTFMLFQNGGVVHDGVKIGFTSDRDLQLFIDKHLGSTINAYVQMEAEQKRRRNRRRRTYTYVGYGVGAYPYYGGYGYPYYGGGIGFGFGF